MFYILFCFSRVRPAHKQPHASVWFKPFLNNNSRHCQQNQISLFFLKCMQQVLPHKWKYSVCFRCGCFLGRACLESGHTAPSGSLRIDRYCLRPHMDTVRHYTDSVRGSWHVKDLHATLPVNVEENSGLQCMRVKTALANSHKYFPL